MRTLEEEIAYKKAWYLKNRDRILLKRKASRQKIKNEAEKPKEPNIQ